MKEENHIKDIIMEKYVMLRRKSSSVTSVTSLDTLQGIKEHLRIRMKSIREEMHIYVSYVISLDTSRY